MSDKEYLTAICAFSCFGPAQVKLLLSYFKKAKKIWGAQSSELIQIGLSEQKVLEFDRFRKDFDIKVYFERLEKLKIKVVKPPKCLLDLPLWK
jgi:predicted Rossmann fold nucleotide-binding protein DprA/Smf involved in DNA uptake